MFRSEQSMSDILDAMVVLDEQGVLALDEANEGRSEELTKVKRQLTAARKKVVIRVSICRHSRQYI
jgi:hypothetical protein